MWLMYLRYVQGVFTVYPGCTWAVFIVYPGCMCMCIQVVYKVLAMVYANFIQGVWSVVDPGCILDSSRVKENLFDTLYIAKCTTESH